MNLTYHYIYVTADPLSPGRSTRVFRVVNRHFDDELGQIRWYGAWRQHCFFPRGGETVWSAGCLRDICDALKKIADARKVERGYKPAPAPGKVEGGQ